MLDQRRRQWASIEPALGQRLVFDGLVLISHIVFRTSRGSKTE